MTIFRLRSRFLQHVLVGGGDLLGRDARHLGDDQLDFLDVDQISCDRRPGSRRWRAPASSITSMALSGSRRSLMCLTDRSTAAWIASAL